MRRTRGMRRSRHYTQKTPIHGHIAGAVPISERPACIEDRAVPGHWEDLLFGDTYSQIATLVERNTRYVMLVKLVDKESYTVGVALARHAQTFPRQLYLSLTWDRGREMAGHKRFTLATDIQVYFCDPQDPWQLGSNETPMDCFDSGCAKALTCLHTLRTARTLLRESSINDHAKLWDIERLLKCSMRVLRRSVESTTVSRRLDLRSSQNVIGQLLAHSESPVVYQRPLQWILVHSQVSMTIDSKLATSVAVNVTPSRPVACN